MKKILVILLVTFLPSLYVAFLGYQATQNGLKLNDVIWLRVGEGVCLLGLGFASAVTVATIDKIRNHRKTQKMRSRVLFI